MATKRFRKGVDLVLVQVQMSVALYCFLLSKLHEVNGTFFLN